MRSVPGARGRDPPFPPDAPAADAPPPEEIVAFAIRHPRGATFLVDTATKGQDLSPSLVALMHWGDRWYADDGPPTVLVHDECGTPLQNVTRCPECSEDIAPAHISSRPGRTEHT